MLSYLRRIVPSSPERLDYLSVKDAVSGEEWIVENEFMRPEVRNASLRGLGFRLVHRWHRRLQRPRRGILCLAALLALGAACGPGPEVVPHPVPPWLAATGFEARRLWPSAVLHLNREEVGGARSLGLLLGGAPELTVGRAEGEGWGVYRRTPEGGRGCALTVFVNGVRSPRIDRAGSRLDIDGLISPRSIAGLEVHLGSEGPVHVPDGCGAVVLWTPYGLDASTAAFQGRVVADIRGSAADTVIALRLDPGAGYLRIGGAGIHTLQALPGLYELLFLSASGPLDRRSVRVYAHYEAWVELEVSRDPP